MTTPTDEYVDITLNGTQVLLIGLVLCGMFFGTGYVVGFNQSLKGPEPPVADAPPDRNAPSPPATPNERPAEASLLGDTSGAETAPTEMAATETTGFAEPSPAVQEPESEPPPRRAAPERAPAVAPEARQVAANRAPSQPRPAAPPPQVAAAAPASPDSSESADSIIHLEVSTARAGDNPQKLVSELRLKGFQAVLKAPSSGEPDRILVGPYRKTDDAMKQWTRLRQNGFEAWLVRQ